MNLHPDIGPVSLSALSMAEPNWTNDARSYRPKYVTKVTVNIENPDSRLNFTLVGTFVVFAGDAEHPFLCEGN